MAVCIVFKGERGRSAGDLYTMQWGTKAEGGSDPEAKFSPLQILSECEGHFGVKGPNDKFLNCHTNYSTKFGHKFLYR